jgi:hypothetical protein
MNAPFLTSNFSLLEEQPFVVLYRRRVMDRRSPPSNNLYTGLPVPEEPLCFSAGEVA